MWEGLVGSAVINCVAQKWVANSFQMHSDLVSAASEDVNFQKRVIAQDFYNGALCMRFSDFGGAWSAFGGGSDGGVALSVFWVASEREVDGKCGGLYCAFCDTNVFFFCCVLFELRHEESFGGGRFGCDDNATRLFIQAVDDAGP